MKTLTKKFIPFLLTFALVLGMIPFTVSAATDVASVGSLLDSYVKANGETYTLTTSSRILVVSDSAPEGSLLQTAQLIQRQFAAAGYPSSTALELVWGPENYAWEGDIVLKVDSSAGLGTEGYKLDVGSTAMITANDVDGLIYGANMLMKCFGYGESLTLAGFTAQDAPDTKQRVVSLDCGRKYYTAEWIMNFIRQMSWMGYNTLQLHFSEDGGFRADFWDSSVLNKYTSSYSPTNDFSWLCGSEVQYWVYNGNKNNTSYDYQTDPNADDYLTTEELIKICNVAKEYHIDIIPSFDSPAHMDYITWRYEQYAKSNGFSFTYNGTKITASSSKNYCINYTDTTGKSSPTWYYAAVDITAGSVGEAFTFALYSDIADFFKVFAGSTDFSIGADEVGQGDSVKWDYEDFVTYINKLNGILYDKGYTMRMYNDFMGSTTYNYSSTTSTSNSYTYDSNIEIMYWDSPFNQNNNSSSGTNTVKASVLAKEGFKLYNCIQSNCYYVLRVANSSSVSSTYKYMDARNPDNLNWSFNYSTEQRIYETWTPNDFGEKGKYSTTDVVSDSYIEGAYFLIWNDYAALNTEKEVWEGVYDNTGTDNSEYYSLFDRMWSNTMKMWNWDVDDSVTYSNFKAVRETYGYFPGYTSCSAAASLPASTSVTEADEYRADHSALNTALANKISNDDEKYTSDSYAKYEAAYAAAEKVNAEKDATAEEISAAITALNEATNALEENKEDSGDTGNTDDDNTGTSSGTTTGTTLEYELSRLEYWKANVINEQGSYTDDSWAAYNDAKTELENFDVTGKTRDEVHAVVSAYEAALSALAVNADETQIISITALSKTVRSGKQVGLKVVTTGDVSALTVDGATLNVCSGKVQTLSDGSVVKVWLIYFNAGTEMGDITYTVNAGNDVTESVTVTIK